MRSEIPGTLATKANNRGRIGMQMLSIVPLKPLFSLSVTVASLHIRDENRTSFSEWHKNSGPGSADLK